MPVLTGILLNMVPPSQRTLANTIANLIYNLLGYLPAPFVYGIVYEYTGGGTSRWGYFAIQASCFVTSFMLVIGLVIQKVRAARDRKKRHASKSKGGAAVELLDSDQRVTHLLEE